jgi:hypothetical protein
VQTISIANLRIRVTIAALPEFTATRRTNNPELLVVFAGVMTLALLTVFAVVIVHLDKHERLRVASIQAAEQHQRKLADAARDAHEKTIAYACHQLRYCAMVCSRCSTALLVVRRVIVRQLRRAEPSRDDRVVLCVCQEPAACTDGQRELHHGVVQAGRRDLRGCVHHRVWGAADVAAAREHHGLDEDQRGSAGDQVRQSERGNCASTSGATRFFWRDCAFFLSLIMPLFPLCFNVLILIEHCQAERACRMHSQRARSHEDFSVTLSVSQMVPYAVMVDQRFLEKMLSNGVSNAVKVRD